MYRPQVATATRHFENFGQKGDFDSAVVEGLVRQVNVQA
jgi:hypothetical protein